MPSINSTIKEFMSKEKNDAFADGWQDNYALDFIEQYWIAFDNFEKVKGAQNRIDQALDQLKLDLAVAALTICSGGGTLLGEVALMQAAGRVVLDAICRGKMHKTF